MILIIWVVWIVIIDDNVDIEKELGDVDLDEVNSGDLSDIEAEILAEL